MILRELIHVVKVISTFMYYNDTSIGSEDDTRQGLVKQITLCTLQRRFSLCLLEHSNHKGKPGVPGFW